MKLSKHKKFVKIEFKVDNLTYEYSGIFKVGIDAALNTLKQRAESKFKTFIQITNVNAEFIY